ncbi:MAG: hypothetical protein LBF68_00690 [Christensenellaceae bacterium]|jgi:hypothetical protein|nr:hypothetical protein [Christensenellaceae bacterium]
MNLTARSYVNGGFKWVSNGFYMSNQDVMDAFFVTVASWATITSLVIATKFIVTTLLNAFVGAGTFIWVVLALLL